MEYEEKKGEIVITGGNAGDHVIEIPDRIEGLPVTGIARYAFRDRLELQEVILPETIRHIGGHAFYNCKNLTRLELYDNARDMEDGSFKNCYRLTDIILHCPSGREGCLSNLLADNIQELTLTVLYADGQKARIVFPTFEDDYVENTPARIFQAVSFGTGGLYRQCLQVGSLDYRAVDELFDKSVRDDRFEAGLMNAVYRLLYPYKLFRSAAEHYEEFLRGNDRASALALIDRECSEGLQLMCERELLREETMDELLVAAQAKGNVSITGQLMQYRLSHFAAKKRTFDL